MHAITHVYWWLFISDFNHTCQKILVKLTKIKVQGNQMDNTRLPVDMVKLMGVCSQLVARNKCGGLRNTFMEIPLATHEHVTRHEIDNYLK